MKILLIILLIVFVLLLLVSYVLVCISFKRPKKVQENQEPTEAWKLYVETNMNGRKWLYKNKDVQDVSIQSFDGLTLKGIYVDNGSNKTIVCVHGYMAKDGLYDFGSSIQFLCSTGYNILVVDDRSHGKSEGTFIGFGVLDSLDINHWCKYLVQDKKQESIILYGISMGAATVLNTPSTDLPKEVQGIIADCGFASGYEEVSYQIKEMYHLPSFPLIPLANFWLKVFAHYSLKEKESYQSISKFNGHVLLIHGADDTFVKTSDVYKIYENITCEKELFVVPGAAHAQSYLTDTKGYEDKISNFLKKIN